MSRTERLTTLRVRLLNLHLCVSIPNSFFLTLGTSSDDLLLLAVPSLTLTDAAWLVAGCGFLCGHGMGAPY